MLSVIAFMTITMSAGAGYLQATTLFAVLATFMLTTISYFENCDTYARATELGSIGRRAVVWTMLLSMRNAAVAGFAAYGLGVIVRLAY